MKKTRRFATLLLCAVVAAVFLSGCSNIANFIRGSGNDGNNGNNPQSYSVSIAQGITNGSVTCNKTSACAGETVVLTATPGNGYELTSITAAVGGNPVTVNGTGNIRTFTMPAQNVTVNAQFTLIPPTTYSISIAENIAHGSVTANKTSATEGETVTLTATPANGYQFSTWNVTAEGNETVTVAGGSFTMPAHNVTVSATFTELPPTTYSISVTGGTASVNGTTVTSATAGTTVTITANTPDTGYEVDCVFVNNGAVSVSGTGSTRTFTMPANSVTVNVTFSLISYSITQGSTSNGSFSVSSSATYGSQVTVTTYPATGYQIGSVSVNNGSVTVSGTGSTRTFTMPASNVTVNVTFTPINYSVSIPSSISNGTVTTDKQTAHIGDTVTLTIVPSDGYKLDSISATGATISGTGNTRTFTMPAADVNVTASFVTIKIGTKNRPNAVGDIVFNDETALPASEYQNRELTDREKQNAIAVVGFVASFNGVPDYAITVGLKQEYLPICSNTSQGYTNTQVFSHDGDAEATRQAICYAEGGIISDYSQSNYPAIYWAQNYTGFGNLGSINNDWFIPTQQELLYVYEGKEAIMAAIDKIGSQYADSFIHEDHTYYHTVTQFSNSETHICLVNLEDGNDNYGQYKDSYGPVLVIRYFQCH